MTTPTRRRAEPISKRTAKNGTVSYEFRLDVGQRADGARHRERFTYRTLAEARREYRRISTDVATGKYVARQQITVSEFLTEWLDVRRDVRPVTLSGYRRALQPAITQLGGQRLQQLTKAHVDDLVEWRMSAGKADARRLTDRAIETLNFVRSHPEGVTYGQTESTLGVAGAKCLDRLLAAGRVTRPARGRYVAATEPDGDTTGVSGRTVATMLTLLSAALDDAMAAGYVTRNVAKLVERPKVQTREMSTWTPHEAATFRHHAEGQRTYALWLLTLTGLRRSEVLGLRWDAVDLDAATVAIVQGRVVLPGQGTTVGDPKSARSKRVLPMPPTVIAALRSFKATQAAERLIIGAMWPDTGLVAVNTDGSPIRPETYSRDFKQLAKAAGVPVIRLHDVRHTSVTGALDAGQSVAAVAKWHGHDPAMTLRVYGHVYDDSLAAVGASMFGGAAQR